MYHNAGLAEPGSASSYIDAVILRDKDASTAWASAADSVLDERIFYCQNWRADVVALISSAGKLAQHVRYGEYGDPFGMPTGDSDGDGDYDSTDANQLQVWHFLGPYDVRGDTDLDGDVDINDYNKLSYHTLGWGKLSETSIANRKGYAGYETDHIVAALVRLNHVRNRVYNVTLGRWMTRDPIGYADGPSLYQYSQSNPIGATDELGEQTTPISNRKCNPYSTRVVQYTEACWCPSKYEDREGNRICSQQERCRFNPAARTFIWTHRPDLGDKRECGYCACYGKKVPKPPKGPAPGTPTPWKPNLSTPCERFLNAPNLDNCIDCCKEMWDRVPGIPGQPSRAPDFPKPLQICISACLDKMTPLGPSGPIAPLPIVRPQPPSGSSSSSACSSTSSPFRISCGVVD